MLTGPAATQFSKRHPAAVAGLFSKVSGYWASTKWIDPQNKYLPDRSLIGDDLATNAVQDQSLAEYITASVTVHTLDGWSFLSRAVAAQLSGDHDCARHLGYYAELRAAMAILGSAAVGVFDHQHTVIDSSAKCLAFPGKTGGTHRFVWLALDSWANSTDARDVVLNAIKAGDLPLKDWIQHFAASGAVAQAQAGTLLKSWGMDLSMLAKDRESRNLASYSPTFFNSARPPKVKETITFVSKLWRLCDGKEIFGALDLEIVRAVVWSICGMKSASSTSLRFSKQIETALNSLSPVTQPAIGWKAFLEDFSSAGSSFLSMAEKQDPPTSANHSMQVLARAFLLLRIGTAQATKAIRGAAVGDKGHLDKLLNSIGEDRSLWPPGKMPTPLSDLYQDADEAIKELDANMPTSYHELWTTYARNAAALCGCERVGMWAISG